MSKYYITILVCLACFDQYFISEYKGLLEQAINDRQQSVIEIDSLKDALNICKRKVIVQDFIFEP